MEEFVFMSSAVKTLEGPEFKDALKDQAVSVYAMRLYGQEIVGWKFLFPNKGVYICLYLCFKVYLNR